MYMCVCVWARALGAGDGGSGRGGLECDVASGAATHPSQRRRPHCVLETIFPSPILYGVWYTKEGSVGGRILRNGRSIVLQ